MNGVRVIKIGVTQNDKVTPCLSHGDPGALQFFCLSLAQYCPVMPVS